MSTSSCNPEALTIKYRTVHQLRRYLNNARTHSKAQIRKIAASIREFGFTNPVLVDSSSTIVAGHGRVEAAKLLKMAEVPTVELAGLSEDQIRAYILADNKLAEQAGWDQAILKIELQHLLNLDTNFDVTLTGFDVAEIDLILQDDDQPKPEDEIPTNNGPTVTQVGDLWLLGPHKLLCGSSLDEFSFGTLMGGKQANVIFADPPYNVRIDGHVCGNGAIKHDEFAMASGEMTEQQFTTFLEQSFSLMATHSKDGSVHFLCMDWRHMREILAAGTAVYDALLNLCVWVKDNGGMGSFYRSRHELVFVYRHGKAQHRNNVQLGRFGRNRTNVWEFPGINTLSRNSEEGNLLSLHPTVKPIALVADALLDASAPKDIVLDPFLGSGTTLLAAERAGRVCYGIELDPQYVDVAILRWQALTGGEAINLESGKTYNQQRNDRGAIHAEA